MNQTEGYARLYANIAAHVEEHGWSVIGTPGFSYTIGLALKGLPELLIIGPFAPRQTMGVLNVLGDTMRDLGRAFDDNERVSLGGKFPVCAVRAADIVRQRFTVQAGQFLGREDYDVMQIVYCDLTGRFPWEPGCAYPFSDIEILRRISG